MVFEALYILFMAGTNGTDADNVSGMAQILKVCLLQHVFLRSLTGVRMR